MTGGFTGTFCHSRNLPILGPRVALWPDGERIVPSPSPRNMDELKVDAEKLKQGEVWIEFVNYYPGKEDREEKPT